MIQALQSTQPILPNRPVTPGGRNGEAPPPLPVGGGTEEARQTFRETRGFGVSGSNLVTAQEEAGKLRKATEDAPKPETGLSSDLSKADQDKVRDLQARDREVRAHEQAHARVGGQHAGAPEYEFERGPDGRSYAVGGHVSISTAPVAGDPEATVRKMEQVKRAALAPSEPSGQDRRVAADAEAKRNDARAELNEIRREEIQAEFDGEETPETLEAAKVETDADSGKSPFEEALDPLLPEGLRQSGGRDDSGEKSGRDEPTAASGLASDPGADDASTAAPVSSFSQQIESFTRTLDRAFDTVSGFAGGVDRLDVGQSTQAEVQTTTRRTGVDIRV